MTLKQIATMIPAEYRREILQTNMISQAIASNADTSMHYLGTIWKTYVSPDEDLGCGMCLERILNNYRQLQPILVEMEQESRLLDTI